MTKPKVIQEEALVRNALWKQASTLLWFAFAVSVALIVYAATSPENGLFAVRAIGGFPVEGRAIDPKSMEIVFALDILFPVVYGAAFAVFATALQARGNRPLIRIILLSVAIAVFSDFAENAIIFSAVQSGATPDGFFIFTAMKYGGLIFAGMMLSTLVHVSGWVGQGVFFLLRYAFPLSGAVLISSVFGIGGRELVGLFFPLMLVLLAVYARQRQS